MKIEIEIPDSLIDTVIQGIMENYPEAGAGNSLKCTKYRYDALKFTFEDEESGKYYSLGKSALRHTFPLLFTDKWPKGCTPVPCSNDAEVWDDWLCQCDATDF